MDLLADINLMQLMVAIMLSIIAAGMVWVGFAITLTRGEWVVMGIITVICIIANPSDYGTLNPSPFAIFYNYGTYSTHITVLQISIFSLFISALIRNAYNNYSSQHQLQASLPQNPNWWGVFLPFMVMTGIFFAQLIADPRFLKSDDWWSNFHQPSWDLVIWQGALIYVVYHFLKRRQDLRRMATIMVAVIALVHIWGLIRYVFLGGDPNNAYAFLEKIAIKITYWDINHAITAAFLIGYSTWKTLVDPPDKAWQRWVYAGLALVGMASIVFSARRTAQGGLVFALVAILIGLPRGKRGIIILMIILSVPLALLTTAQRSKESGSVIDKVLLDVKKDRIEDPRSTRFYELKRAWMTVEKSPWFGLGPKGAFQVIDPRGLEYHRNHYGFVHSGFGHIILKAGLVTVSFYVAMLLAFTYTSVRAWRRIPKKLRPLALGCFAALASSIPNFSVGTPVVEPRSMYLMGLLMALMMACVRLAPPNVNISKQN